MDRCVVMLLTDGRGYVKHALASFVENIFVPNDMQFTSVIVDDSANTKHYDKLCSDLPNVKVIAPESKKRGFYGAIQAGWDYISTLDAEWVFHLEEDFVFNQTIPIVEMKQILLENPHLAQVVLKRQPWGEAEVAAGGIVECWPDLYEDHSIGDISWCEHDLFFTTNPSLYHKSIIEHDWPQMNGSEAEFTKKLKSQGKRFAFFGKKFDAPRVTHVGNVRTGTGY